MHKYDSIPFQAQINNIKLFQKDKLICITYEHIFIYRITDKKLLYSLNLIHNTEIFPERKIEIYQNDKFFLFDKDAISDLLRLYHFTKNEETNLYTCSNILNINEKPYNILFEKNKMFCVSRRLLSIYNIINDINFEIQIKIKIPQLIQEYSYYAGIIMNKNNLKICEYKEKMIIWDYKNYKLEYESEINEKFFLIKLKKLNKNTFFITNHCSHYIYLYSSKSKKVIFKIYGNFLRIHDIFITRKGEIYLNDSFYIAHLDLKNKIIYDISRSKEPLGESLIVLPNNTFICSSEKEIKFLKFSKISNIKRDIKLYLFTYFRNSLGYIFTKTDLFSFLLINLFSSIFGLWLFKKIRLYNNLNKSRALFYIIISLLIKYFFIK